LRFRLVAFLVRMWLVLAWPALYLPEAVFRKRLAAPRCVLILIFDIAVVLGSFLVLAWAASSRVRFGDMPPNHAPNALSFLPGRFVSLCFQMKQGGSNVL